MARHLLCGVAVALVCAAPGIAAEYSPTGIGIKSTVLTIAITGDCPVSEGALAMARAEATRIWSQGDVGLRWMAPSKLPFTAPKSDWLLVQCSADPVSAAPSEERLRAVATIRFLDAQPMNVITLNPQNASVLLDQDAREGRLQNHRFPAMRHVRLGRMLGRALAHEIGHFLSQSAAHTERGLMKPTHSVAAFTGVSLQPFSISSDFRKVLCARRTAHLSPTL
jgi:hypothetical protein